MPQVAPQAVLRSQSIRVEIDTLTATRRLERELGEESTAVPSVAAPPVPVVVNAEAPPVVPQVAAMPPPAVERQLEFDDNREAKDADETEEEEDPYNGQGKFISMLGAIDSSACSSSHSDDDDSSDDDSNSR